MARAAVQVWDADALAYETFAPLCDPTAVGPVRSDTTTGRVVWPPPWWSLLIGARSFCLELNTTHGGPKEGGVNTTHLLPRSSMEDLDSDFERSSRELAHPESGTDSLAQGARSTVVAMVPLYTLAHRAYLRRDTLLDSTVR